MSRKESFRRNRKRKPAPIEVTAIVRAPDPASSAIEPRRPELEERLKAKAVAFATDAIPDNTRRGYESDAKQFGLWCREMGYRSLPAAPRTVVLYITAMAIGEVPDRESRKLATIRRAMSGIAMTHIAAGFDSPLNDDVMRVFEGMRRTLPPKQTQKTALLDDDIVKMIDVIPDDIQGIRDSALILFGQHAALRRDELERLDRSWLTFGEAALAVEIPSSKTSKEPEEFVVPRGIPPYCPVAALERWLCAVDKNIEHVFCQFTQHRAPRWDRRITGFGIARVVKRLVQDCGIGDPATYSGHSLRRGFVTQQNRDGVSIDKIMETTRHKSYDTVRRYVQKEDVFSRIGKKINGTGRL